MKDLVITFNNDLNFSQHVCKITRAANVRCNLIMKFFILMVKSYKSKLSKLMSGQY